MKFPTIFLLRFYEMERFWTPKHMNKALKAFPEDRSIRHGADLFKVPQTRLRRAIAVEGNTTKTEVSQNRIHP
jgi:hypothetical protein